LQIQDFGELVVDNTFRYQQIPTFGTSTIRQFSSNASAMKKLAARDFEDLLQVWLFFDNQLCCNFMPVFNSSIREPTSKQTPQYPDHGHALQQFVKVICSCYATKELPREEAA
jgi:hypothetical protein